MVTYVEAVDEDEASWCAIWFVPSSRPNATSFQLRVISHDGTVRRSPAFDPTAAGFWHRFAN